MSKFTICIAVMNPNGLYILLESFIKIKLHIHKNKLILVSEIVSAIIKKQIMVHSNYNTKTRQVPVL